MIPFKYPSRTDVEPALTRILPATDCCTPAPMTGAVAVIVDVPRSNKNVDASVFVKLFDNVITPVPIPITVVSSGTTPGEITV